VQKINGRKLYDRNIYDIMHADLRERVQKEQIAHKLLQISPNIYRKHWEVGE